MRPRFVAVVSVSILAIALTSCTRSDVVTPFAGATGFSTLEVGGWSVVNAQTYPNGGRLKALEQEMQGLHKRAIEATLMAIVGLVIFISVGSILTYSTSFVIEVIGQGLIVVGWVFVWFPLDSFVFGVRHYRLDKRIYEKLVNLQLTIKSSS